MSSTSNDNPNGVQAVSSVVAAYNAKLTKVGPKAVLINLGLMAGFALLTLAAFCLLRPRNKLVYEPRRKYYTDERKRAPKIGEGLLDWLGPLFRMKELQIFEEAGMDAVVLLRPFRMCRWIFTIIALLCCSILIPVSVVYNTQNVPSQRRNALSMLTIQQVRGNLLFAFVGMSYVVTIVVCGYIWWNTRKVIELKQRYFRSDDYQNGLWARSIMITGVERRYQTDQGLAQLLASLNIPYPTTAVHIGRRTDELPELIEHHQDSVRHLERVLTKHLRDPNKVPSTRPLMRVGGFLGMGGQRVDAIDYLTSKVQRLEAKIETIRERHEAARPQPYGFASFLKTAYAHVVAKTLRNKKIKGARIQLAPMPHDIIWENLNKTSAQRRTAAFFGGLILIVVAALYTIPLLAVAFLANLSAVTQFVPFLDNWSNNSSITFAAVAGILPPALSLVLQLILPVIFRRMGKFQGARTKTKRDRDVFARYWAFLLITQFFFSIISVIFQLVVNVVNEIGKGQGAAAVLKEFSNLPGQLQTTYVQSSSYWLTWLPLQTFTATFELAQVLTLVYVVIRKNVFSRTVRDIREWTKPAFTEFPIVAASYLLMFAVGIIYAPLAPLVAIAAAVGFFITSMVYKYLLVFVYVTKVESGGRLWRPMVNRMLVSTVISSLIMILTVGLQQGWIRAISAAPPILIVFCFKLVLNTQFRSFDYYIPSDAEIASSRAHHNDERKHRLAKRFGHPSLHEPLFTPLIHASAQHLLSSVYSGRIEKTGDEVAKGEGLNAGGLHFGAVAQQDIELSRADYLRQQNEQWETSSMGSSAMLDATPGPRSVVGKRESGYFGPEAMAAYYAHGPQSRAGTPGAYEDSTPMGYDLSRVQTHQSQESQSSLMRTQQWATQPAQYSQLPRAYQDPYAQHARMGSNADLRHAAGASRESLVRSYHDTAAYPPAPPAGPYRHDRQFSAGSTSSLPPGAGHRPNLSLDTGALYDPYGATSSQPSSQNYHSAQSAARQTPGQQSGYPR